VRGGATAGPEVERAHKIWGRRASLPRAKFSESKAGSWFRGWDVSMAGD
jgi:hypothetical protein